MKKLLLPYKSTQHSTKIGAFKFVITKNTIELYEIISTTKLNSYTHIIRGIMGITIFYDLHCLQYHFI